MKPTTGSIHPHPFIDPGPDRASTGLLWPRFCGHRLALASGGPR